VLTTSVFEFPTGRGILLENLPFQYEIADQLLDVPALPETLLAIELQLRGRCVDLREISAVVLGDLGATIQILRLAGREYQGVEDAPSRIEDCISDLGLEECLNAAASRAFVRGSRQSAAFEMWAHSREIAQYCRLLAEESYGPINPQDAYMAGLLHAMGALPEVLAWGPHKIANDRALSAFRMAEQWFFPLRLKEFFLNGYKRNYTSHWSEIMATAHDLARDSWARCPLCDTVASRGYKGKSAC
jgi:HD-like signal output (HDOD) protein